MKAKSIAILVNSIIAGIISCIISALLNYYILPFPESIFENATSHGIGSFFSGFFSAVIGILIYSYQCKQDFVNK